MQQVSMLLNLVFGLTTVITIVIFFNASKKSKPFLTIVLVWALLQMAIGLTNFYANGFAIPPRFAFLIIPPVIFIIILFVSKKGRAFVDSLNVKQLTLLHTIRIPVELVLYFLFMAKTIPQIMTFEGKNFDVIAGVTAPIIYYFGYVKNKLPKLVLIIWNIACLALLLNIVVIAIFSANTPFQKFGFTQPNIAIAHFPFNWLASVIVPLVLLAHLATLRQLFKKRINNF